LGAWWPEAVLKQGASGIDAINAHTERHFQNIGWTGLIFFAGYRAEVYF